MRELIPTQLVCAVDKRMPVAVITGASTGIGREFAHICAADGYDVVLVARSEAALRSVALEVERSTGRKSRVVALDLTDPEAPARLLLTLADLLADVEILINNAGFGLLGEFAELDALEQVRMVQLNVTALTHLTRLFAPALIARRKGFVLNVASTAAFQPGPSMAVYFATKAYVVSLSSALHEELRAKGVVVTAFCPGATRTAFQARAGIEESKLFAANAMDARPVAEIGYRALKAGRALVVAGRKNALLAFLTRFAPRQLEARMARKVMENQKRSG
jgi:short-subunit dehydrogenase